jgi:hypothetical protein
MHACILRIDAYILRGYTGTSVFMFVYRYARVLRVFAHVSICARALLTAQTSARAPCQPTSHNPTERRHPSNNTPPTLAFQPPHTHPLSPLLPRTLPSDSLLSPMCLPCTGACVRAGRDVGGRSTAPGDFPSLDRRGTRPPRLATVAIACALCRLQCVTVPPTVYICAYTEWTVTLSMVRIH